MTGQAGWGDVPVLAIETEGAASFDAAARAGALVTLPAITSVARTLGAKTVCSEALAWALRRPVLRAVISDAVAVGTLLQFAGASLRQATHHNYHHMQLHTPATAIRPITRS